MARPLPPEVWSPLHRAAAVIALPIQRVLALEAASGLALFAMTAVALAWANLAPHSYTALWELPVGLRLGPWHVERSLHFVVNDGLMTLFFLVVGLEIRREIAEGELATVKRAALPLAAALGGMIAPAVVYAALNAGRSTLGGWGIPMATDIAFAVGALTLLGSRVPAALRILLLGLAVVDDVGAIVVIALVYSHGLSLAGFGIVGLGLAGVVVLRGAGVRQPLAYVPAGIVVWCGMVQTGIHAATAGVLLGMLAPARPWTHAGETVSPIDRILTLAHPWVTFGVMPLFALANAGVTFGTASLAGDAGWMVLGIVAGLVVGKPLGIVTATWLAGRAGVAVRSEDVTRRGLVLVGLVGGIGFTMSLFVAALAFPPGPLLDTAKLAILVGSGGAMLAGLAFGRTLAANGARDRQPSPEA